MSINELVILKELKKLLTSAESKSLDVVSLNDISKLMNLKYKEYNTLIKRFQNYLEEKKINKIKKYY